MYEVEQVVGRVGFLVVEGFDGGLVVGTYDDI